MGQVSRRGFLLGVMAGASVETVGSKASATIMRALSLPALVQGSRRIVVMTPLAAESHFEELGRRRRIVTDTRVRVEEVLAKQADASELLVRTLGGAVGRLGEQVQGQARMLLGVACVAFLLDGPDGLSYFNGMAQGHYPLTGEARRILGRSPDLPELLDAKTSAVAALVGSKLDAATARIRALVQP